ncbi:uncharacterized protein UTRI_04314_B [Ustilago trichophora]|uniref:Zn(2)-C6 fungal-type domain-containing protein n=1 Tax=Ustilago trichophora TaxID=86804 RepID=A0A5C3EBU2_9BASI|nr:uncharacterized protein UTRI_04314_B [Ustilago trichophora]
MAPQDLPALDTYQSANSMTPDSGTPRSPKRQRIVATIPPDASDKLKIHATSDTRTGVALSAGTPRAEIAPPSAPPANAPSLAAKPSQPYSSTSRSPSIQITNTTQAVHKRRFTRSRSGCSTCRTRKIKCDELRPHCRRCLEDGRLCQGYGQQQQYESQPTQRLSQPPVHLGKSTFSIPQNETYAARPHPHRQSSPPREQRARPIQASDATNVEATASHLATSPQHLDDWIDLLCASIGNDIQQPSTANLPVSNTSSGSNGQTGDKDVYQHHTALSRHPTTLSKSKNTMPPSPHAAGEEGLSALASAAIGASQAQAEPGSPAWLNEDWLSIFTASPTSSDAGFGGRRDSVGSSSTRTGLPALERISEADLQRRIRALCVTKVQLESVSFFFNTTARCFHLLSADTNVWRIFFAQLASESPMILDLIGCLGLTHLSLTQDHRKKGLAHAHFSRCKTEWDSLVGQLGSPESIDQAAAQITTAHRVLEVLAGTILIAHIEQFSRGFATISRSCTALALILVRRSLMSAATPLSTASWLDELDQGPGSAFRFFVRILVWWEVMSRTMGPGSEQGDVLDIIQHVFRWEEDDARGQDPIDCFTQCVVGWPLDLLEAVERTTRLSLDREILAYRPLPATSTPLMMPSVTLSHALEGFVSLQVQQQIDAVETQIRLARPLPLVQDDSIAAELRYLIFECLQSASLVYFCKVLLKSTDAVWFEVDKVTRFLERKQQRGSSGGGMGPEQSESNHAARVATGSSVSGDLHLAQAMENRGKWWIRAPDGALIWAYFQCASEIFGELDSSTEVLPCAGAARAQVRHQIGRGEPTTLALGSQLTLGSEIYSAFAASRSDRRQRCRRSLLLWERFDEIQCVFLCRHLLKAMWDRRDLYEQHTRRPSLKNTEEGTLNVAPGSGQAPYDQAAELDDICRQRRWRQPLIF